MRELSKVFQGVILATRDRFNRDVELPFGGNITGPDGYLLALWIHECRRVFSDKLVRAVPYVCSCWIRTNTCYWPF